MPWPADMPPAVQLQSSPHLDEPCPKAEVKLFGPLRELLAKLVDDTPRSGFSCDEISEIKLKTREKFAPLENEKFPTEKILSITRKIVPNKGILILESAVYNLLAEHVKVGQGCMDIGYLTSVGGEDLLHHVKKLGNMR